MYGHWVGVDPGANDTGLVVINDDGELVAWQLVRRNKQRSIEQYHRTVLDEIVRLVDLDTIAVAVETIVAPNFHATGRRTRFGPLLATAELVGYVAGACVANGWQVVRIAPAGHGSRPLGHYPPELVSRAERNAKGPHPWQQRVGKGERRHLRSAYDVARAAIRTATDRSAAPL